MQIICHQILLFSAKFILYGTLDRIFPAGKGSPYFQLFYIQSLRGRILHHIAPVFSFPLRFNVRA